MLTLTRELKENKPFSLTKKVFSHYDRVCVRCNRDVEACTCYPVDKRDDAGKDRYHWRKVQGRWQTFREPSIFGESCERRRYKTITFTEEDLEVTQRLAAEYWAFIREELTHKLITL